MKKLLPIFLMTSLLSVSCNKSDGGSSNEVASSDTTETSIQENNETATSTNTAGSAVPAQALTFDTNILLLNFSASQEEKYNQAIEIARLVVGTEEFRKRVLNHTYNGAKTFVDNGGKTNAQIYQSILDAAEVLQPIKNNTMDLEVELYYEFSSTVGYTMTNSRRIWVNTKFFNSYTANSVSGNLFHEWLHKLGYKHDVSATSSRPYSVPYAIGYIMADIGKKFL